MKTRTLLLIAATAMGIASCSSDGNDAAKGTASEAETTTTTGEETTKRPFHVYTPQATWPLDEGRQALLGKVNDYALGVFRLALAESEGGSNIFSPLSLNYAVAMTGLACDGTPLEQLNTALGLDADDTTSLHDLMASLMLGLPKQDNAVDICLANAFYSNSSRGDVMTNPEFQKALREAYKADCQTLDFGQQATLDYMNQWCSEQTKGFIPKVFDQLDPTYISCLLNALYFKGDWTIPFPTDLTREEKFMGEDGSCAKLPMMISAEPTSFQYAEDELMQAVRLPYANGHFGMTILLPREGHTTSDIVGDLSAERLTALAKEMKYEDVLVSLPRFETKQTTQLIEPMERMGLSSWFHGDNIRGMVLDLDGTTPHGVYIAEAFQVARIKVNEKGTEAAAVTVFAYTDKCGPDNPKEFRADHPFVYLITEEESGAVLFIGTYQGETTGNTETGIMKVES